MPRIDVKCKTINLAFTAQVTLSTVVLKRILIEELGSTLKWGGEFSQSREEFLTSVGQEIKAYGIDRLSLPPRVDWGKIPGGSERLYEDFAVQWKRIFVGHSEDTYSFTVELSLSASEIIKAYAFAREEEIVDLYEDAEEPCDASAILGYVAQAYIERGEFKIDLYTNNGSEEYCVADTAVRRTLPFLFEDFQFGTSFDVRNLWVR